MKTLAILLLLHLAAAVCRAQTPATKPADLLAGLREKHPRLILTPQRLDELKILQAQDPTLQALVTQCLAQADQCLDAPPLQHKLIGPRLLQVSKDCLRRTYTLGLAWRLTGNEKYARALADNLRTVCAFTDWNPSHFLDVAEMTHAVAIGYDWLYDYLDATTRQQIRQKLVELGLNPGLHAYAKKAWWIQNEFNWNPVCNGGLTIGALAVAESEPEIARTILTHTRAALPHATATYEPDGAWAEGPAYWFYATTYTAYALAALDSALGTDFGLSDTQGLRQAGYFPLYATGPTGMFVNYADAGERGAPRPTPVLFWLAHRYGDRQLASAQLRLLALLAHGEVQPQDVIWYLPPAAKATPLALDKRFGGVVELALFRTAWDDPNALFASLKAGANTVGHAHLDLGTFELDALGQRWARDLGKDDYNLPGYFDSNEGGQRWTYYRIGSFSHNILTLNGQQQPITAQARMTDFQEGPSPYALVDLTNAYPNAASRVQRGLALVAGRKAVLVQDELTLTNPADLLWGMTTDAEISLDGPTATLKLGGQTLMARILQPAGAAFSVASAARPAPEKTNQGVQRLLIKLRPTPGEVRLAVLLSPVWPEGKDVQSVEVQPLKNWKK